MEDLEIISIYDYATRAVVEVEVERKVAVIYKREHWREENSDRSFKRFNTTITDLKGGSEEAFENFNEFLKLASDPNAEACEAEIAELRECRISMLHEAVESLIPAQRYLINQIYFNGKTQEDLAAEKGVNQSSVSKQLNRALKNLRKFFASRGA